MKSELGHRGGALSNLAQFSPYPTRIEGRTRSASKIFNDLWVLARASLGDHGLVGALNQKGGNTANKIEGQRLNGLLKSSIDRDVAKGQ